MTYAGNLDSLRTGQRQSALCFRQGRTLPDRPAVDRAFAEHRPTAVIHFAAESHVDRSIDNPSQFVVTNVLGTFHMLDAALRYWSKLAEPEKSQFRFLHVSTDEVYGSLGPTGLFTEDTSYDPSSPYSASKASSDHIARAYHRTYGLPVLITNCSNNYGPYQFPEKLIPLMILNALEGRKLPVYGDGMNVRDWLFVEDHCRAISCVLAKGKPGRNLQHWGQLRAAEHRDRPPRLRLGRRVAARASARSLHVAHHLRQRPPRPRPPLCHRRRQDRSRPRLATRSTISVSGLRRTVQWYIDNPRWIERVQSGKYRRERLGLGEA